MFEGQSLQLRRLDGGIAELCFDRKDAAVNLFDSRSLNELRKASSVLAEANGTTGLLVRSAKESFILGADITEFGKLFSREEAEIVDWLNQANEVFSSIEDLPFPSVTAIGGTALGGGFEMALATDFRVMATGAEVGLPETRLGIIPGFGGGVRLSRLIGADNAIEWIAKGVAIKADMAFRTRAVDAVVAPEKLVAAGLAILRLASQRVIDWQSRRNRKKCSLALNAMESLMAFESAAGLIASKSGKHYPAPITALKAIQRGATKSRDEALAIESRAFAKVARSTEADALIGLFLNDQSLKRKAKAATNTAVPVKRAAVLGAGIMGGGIAFQSASKGIPVIMKDIGEEQLDLGMAQATRLLNGEIARNRLTPAEMGAVLSHIRPTLSYGEFNNVDLVIEAVVERPDVKKNVLAELEKAVRPDTVIATNTSSISIDILAAALAQPANFLGMHFFNPVHRMPLVEVIYGRKTSQDAIATASAYATAMGKTPIVVRDCPGFLVNRILFPYFAGWLALLRDGADFVMVDRVMEDFGWPMGPAYLQDVVGIDTSYHVSEVLAAGYPDRMAKTFRTVLDVMYERMRYGQKSGTGFYRYEIDKSGKRKKIVAEDTHGLIAEVQQCNHRDFSQDEIVDRLMIPMIIETARCLEEGIVKMVAEADMGLILGIGFPPFRGGALKYADTIGLQAIVEKAGRYVELGKLYEVTATMKKMAANGQRYYPR